MKFRAISFALTWSTLLASAGKVSFKQVQHVPPVQTLQRRADSPQGIDLRTVHDLIYILGINVAGKDYAVQLDTGSSDLWIKGDTHPLPDTNQTSISQNVSYAIGWVFGSVAYAPVEFANLSVPSQALLDVSNASNPALSYGAKGVVGLGFTSLSTVDRVVNNTGQGTGRSLLYNLFHVHPEEPNFLAFSLQRSTEQNTQTEGSFSIGEYDPDFAAVANSSKIPTWPPKSPERWNVLVDAVIVGDNIVVPGTSVPNAPSNKAVALMDSGSSYSYVSKEVADALYSHIPGASFDSNLGQWIVPCDQEIDAAIQIGGQIYPLHPLDISPNGLVNTTSCVGSFVPQPVAIGAGYFDWILGANVLRSVYSVYDFGDFDQTGKPGDPFFQFLSVTEPNKASTQFHAARGGVAKTGITYKGIEGAGLAPSGSLSKDAESAIEKFVQFLPAILGVVALNALAFLILIVVGSVIYCRRQRAAKAPARTPRGRLSPMPLNVRNTYYAGGLGSPAAAHTYEPVSMALTEDTFVPPSPPFRKFDSQDGDRPKSVA